jgi:hypothetical protein
VYFVESFEKELDERDLEKVFFYEKVHGLERGRSIF